MKHFRIPSTIVADKSHWLFDGPQIDPEIIHTEADARKYVAELLKKDRAFAVIEFNTVEGWVRDVTADLSPEPADDEDEYLAPLPGYHTRAMKRAGAFGGR